MATKIQQVIEANPTTSVMFGEWLTRQGLDAKSQYAYMKSGWLTRMSKGVYAFSGASPTLFDIVSAYNTQLSKHCVIGAYTALELRGYSHYLSLGKPIAYLFTGANDRLPQWMVAHEWDMTIKYMITSFLSDEHIGVESVNVDGKGLLVSSPERAFLECLNMSDASSSLLDIYYIMESLTTLRPKLVQRLLEKCTSNKVKRLFVYMAEKANHPWFKAIKLAHIDLGTSRCLASSTGKYIARYNMIVPKQLAEYE